MRKIEELWKMKKGKKTERREDGEREEIKKPLKGAKRLIMREGIEKNKKVRRRNN